MDQLTTLSAKNQDEFVEVSGQLLHDQIQSFLERQKFCVVGLSGGSTPKPIYSWLGKQTSIDWSRVYFFIVDERYISHDQPTSNTNMIRSTLLAGNNIPESNLVFPDTTLELSACIDDYQVKLTALFQEKGNDKQSAHIVTLGLGPDAHIASLFPPLANHLLPKRLAEVVEIFHTQTEKFDVKDRISTSLDTIHFATLKIFFLTGAEKQLLWGKMLSSDLSDVQNYPALHVFAGGNTVAVTLFESSKL